MTTTVHILNIRVMTIAQMFPFEETNKMKPDTHREAKIVVGTEVEDCVVCAEDVYRRPLFGGDDPLPLPRASIRNTCPEITAN